MCKGERKKMEKVKVSKKSTGIVGHFMHWIRFHEFIREHQIF